MPYGEGANWEGDVDNASENVTVEVTSSASPQSTGSVSCTLQRLWKAPDVAQEIAEAWNSNPQRPAYLYAVCEGGLLVFFSTSPNTQFDALIVTFDGGKPANLDYNESEFSPQNKLVVTRKRVKLVTW